MPKKRSSLTRSKSDVRSVVIDDNMDDETHNSDYDAMEDEDLQEELRSSKRRSLSRAPSIGPSGLRTSDYLESSIGPFDILPEEATTNIFLQFPPKEICRLSIVCRGWYRIAFDNVLWKTVCLYRFGDQGPLEYENLTELMKHKRDINVDNIVKKSPLIHWPEFRAVSTIPVGDRDFETPFKTDGHTDWRRYYWYRDLYCATLDIVRRTGLHEAMPHSLFFDSGVSLYARKAMLVSLGLLSSVFLDTTVPPWSYSTIDLSVFFQFILATSKQSPELYLICAELWERILDQDEEKYVINAKKHLIHVAETFVNTQLEFVTNPELAANAVTVLSTFCEFYPPLLRAKKETLLVPIINSAFTLLQTVSESVALNTEAEFEGTLADLGEELLECVAKVTGGKTIYPLVEKLMVQLLKQDDWRSRRTALLAIFLIGEYCSDQFIENFDNIMKLILSHFDHPHATVQLAAISALAQLCSDFKVLVPSQYSDVVVPALIRKLDDERPLITAHACRAIVNYTEYIGDSEVQFQPDEFLERVLKLVNHSDATVRVEAVTAIAAIIVGLNENAAKYYDLLITPLKTILQSAEPNTEKLNKAMEAIGILFYTADSKQRATDAKEAVEIIQKLDPKITKNEVNSKYLGEFYMRTYKALGTDFAPYLPVMMNLLIQILNVPSETAVYDNEEDIPPERRTTDWEKITVDRRFVLLHTTQMRQKVNALETLVLVMTDSVGLETYATDLTRVILNHLNDPIFPDYKKPAIACMTPLLQLRGPSALPELMQALVRTIPDEDVQEVFLFKLEVVKDMLETFPSAKPFTDQAITIFIRGFMQLYDTQCQVTIEQLAVQLPDDLVDDEEQQEATERTLKGIDAIKVGLLDIFEVVINAYPAVSANWFNLNSFMDRAMHPSARYIDFKACAFMISDAMSFWPTFPPGMQVKCIQFMINKLLSHQHKEIWQACLFTFGAAAKNMNSTDFEIVKKDVVKILKDAIVKPKKWGCKSMVDNAVVSLARVCFYKSKDTEQVSLLTYWLEKGSIQKDKLEANMFYKEFCDFVAANRDLFMNVKLHKITMAHLNKIKKSILDPETMQKIEECKASLQQK